MAQANKVLNLAGEIQLFTDRVYIWGIRDPNINPAVRKVIDMRVLEAYLQTVST